MKVFRDKKRKSLWTIELVQPMLYTGSWYEATPLHGGKVRKHVNLNDFKLVSERP